MSWWNFSKDPADKDLDTELGFHIQELVDEKVAAGMPPDEARRQAILEFGGRQQMKEEVRDVHRSALVDSAVSNFRSAVRFIRKSPSFALTVILTLALGIGANTAVFSAINAVLLRPLPYPDADALVKISHRLKRTPAAEVAVAPIRLEEWNRMNSTFQSMFGYYTENDSEVSGPLPEKVKQALVSPRFVQVFGIAPAVGRDFSPAEYHFGGPRAVILSDQYWRRKFNADPAAVGKVVRFGRSGLTVVGVMPPSFQFPEKDVDMFMAAPPDFPLAQNRENTWYTVIGRLKPAVNPEKANADLDTVQANLGRSFPKTDAGIILAVQPLKETTVSGVRRSLWLLFGSVTVLLLIACTNIAALLLARSTQRQHEISIRFSLGASRSAVIWQHLTEAFVLASIGAALGIGVAAGASRVFRLLARNIPRIDEIRVDWNLAAYTLACAVFATFVCALLPAMRATREGLSSGLSHASRTQVSSRNRLQWLLVGVQVSLAVTLLAGAGLLLRSFQELGRVSAGFDPDRILTLRISGSWAESADMKRLTQRIDRTLGALTGIPGVVSAATSAQIPGIPSSTPINMKIVENRDESEFKVVTETRVVSCGYFETMRIPILSGECREVLNHIDLAVNQSFANTYFPRGDALGHHLVWPGNYVAVGEIKAIVGDAREQGLDHAPSPTVYACTSSPGPDPYYLVRTQGAPGAMAETLRLKIHEIEPSRSVFGIEPLRQHLSDAFAENRMRAILLGFFAFTAISLTCVGLYGTLSYFVAVRRREVGLRLALGALRGHILSRFLLQGLAVTLAGCVAGALLADGFGRLLTSMLYGVAPSDAITTASVLGLVLFVAALASLAPAIRAARLDPMRVLREE